MLNDKITVTKKHLEAAQLVTDELHKVLQPKFILTIGGEVGSGKSTLSYAIAQKLKKQGVVCKIIDLDDFYKIQPKERKAWRRLNGIESVGPDEYDWNKINLVIDDFYQNRESTMPCVDLITDEVDVLTTFFDGIDVLIINGLYATKLNQSNFKVFIELTYDETKEAQVYSEKEEMTEFRKQILEREHQMVHGLKHGINLFFDFDATLDKYHL
ncbi:MAG: zeta toxin family protein [Bacteroidales bacterium]|jgi:uridine kinase|nr:zeta toxin family protein [Bacteroidales bacterium]